MTGRALVLLAALTFAPAARAEPAAVWTKYCLSCHGARGAADTKEGKNHKLPDMRAPAWQAGISDEELRSVIRDGKKDTKMKPFGRKLTAEDLEGLVARIRAFGLPPGREAKRDR